MIDKYEVIGFTIVAFLLGCFVMAAVFIYLILTGAV